MPIKWSARKVSDAMDKVEELVNQATGPMEQAKTVASEARNIPDLPQYIGQRLSRLVEELSRVTGGTFSWNNEPYPGSVRAAITAVRTSLPEGAAEQEKRVDKVGTQLTLGS